MKIGFDVAQTCDQRAGCAWYADALVRAMVPLASDEQFFLYHQFGDWINASTEKGTQIDAPNVTSTFTDVAAAEAARIWNSPAELVIKTGAPDIVHANSFRAPRIPGAKVIFTVYDVSFWAAPHFTTEENRLVCQTGLLQALGNADGFVFISQSAHDEFERMLPGWLEENRRPWQVTPLAPRTRGGAIPAMAAAKPYWLAVGSLEPRKNYETLLDALALYWKRSSRPLPLKIAGGAGWKSEKLKQRIQEMNARHMVTHLGYVPDEDLAGLYSGAKALIFPSWYEGFGLPVVEALAQGCPVISSDRTSLRELAGDGVRFFDPANAEALADTMLRFELAPDPQGELRQRALGQAARFSWKQTAQLTLEFYRRVLRT